MGPHPSPPPLPQGTTATATATEALAATTSPYQSPTPSCAGILNPVRATPYSDNMLNDVFPVARTISQIYQIRFYMTLEVKCPVWSLPAPAITLFPLHVHHRNT